MPATILIVDDSRVVRSMLRETLKIGGHRILEAADGEQGLAVAQADCPELIITDINMPVLDGFGLIRAVRQLPQHRCTPILVVTTEAGEALKQRGREAGATGWLVKPFQPEQLLETTLRALELRQRALQKAGSCPQ
jgi:two-component system chemotaxis response regulator CheY